MKISLKWVQKYCDIPDLPEDLQAFCDKLDLTGTGVEDVAKIGANFDNIVTAKIISKQPHPDSDHMYVTMVDVGEDEPLQIVCGAQNFNVGDHVVTAKIGAVLPGNFKIKKSKLRGVDSMGMNCSEEELGLCDKSDGIMILPDDAPIGMPIADYLKIGDTVIDTEITPNRPDCLSVIGCAREIAAIYDSKFNDPTDDMAAKINDVEIFNLSDKKNDDKNNCIFENMPTVKIEDGDRCARYTARLITGVKIGPSPKWLSSFLTSMGSRSINNIVDITNFVLYFFGQPLHAFDADKLLEEDKTPHIVVRIARDGEKFTTLDGEDRVLNSDMTVISTDKKAVALAGVMGGLDSEVTDQTTNILLETATFNPANTSRTSRRLDLISESSMRYERRVDDVNIDKISDIAVALIVEVAGGKICSSNSDLSGSIVDVYNKQTQPYELKFRIDRFTSMMGADIDRDFVIKTLQNLGCKVDDSSKELKVLTPSYRPDLEREIDLYEEVVRIYGVDKVKSTLPSSPDRVGKKTKSQKLNEDINKTMTSCGVTETCSYSFADEDDVEIFGGEQNEAIGFGLATKLINPMNANQQTMRQTLTPGLLRSVSYNLAHGVNNISLYELGVIFNAKQDSQKPVEKQKLACVLSGCKPSSWLNKENNYDFFDAKGILENLLSNLNVKKIKFSPIDDNKAPHLQPGRCAYVYAKKQLLGWIGEIHPDVCDKFEIDCPVAAFEIDINSLAETRQSDFTFKDIPAYPGIEIDVAFVVDNDITNETMIQRISSAGGKLLNNVTLFDVYKNDEQLGPDKKSMAYKLEYIDPNKTLTREEVDSSLNKLIDKIQKGLGAEIRK